ncbi:DUF1800 domain-containing protein [Trinickia fusca]|uniref:DUF1800 domain-containing protein n=1 Tax=Trinickia fusca TaxID=2419777 RepID=A0A494XPR0_9BURK|nr:DUF1800 domain-containing protein [Trinickia fusca]RKP52637.1 DUF1800 domain-containing protein [Trinickia fusca]
MKLFRAFRLALTAVACAGLGAGHGVAHADPMSPGKHAPAARHAAKAPHRVVPASASVAAAKSNEASERDEALLDADAARFFLTRVGFAPDAAELAPYIGLTREAAVDKVLGEANTRAVTPSPAWAAEPTPTRAEMRVWTPEERRAEGAVRGQRYEQLREWAVREMLTTRSPLTERMTLFWHNHFTSAQDKIAYPQLMAQQDALLRRQALGSFATMLHEVAKDPAMLLYLDGASNRKGKPNENFAREAMELFTLGEGHYSQRDVSEAARAYTGWGLDPDTQQFVFRHEQHDDGVKTVLGRSGPFDGDAVLDILLAEPQTATFVTTKLWREFVSETPDAAVISPIAVRFRASGYDIKTALRALLLTDAFWDERNRGVLVKSPVEFVVGTVRSLDVAYDSTTPFVGLTRNLGQNLFYPPNVKGWPGGSIWINSTTLLARDQFVEQLFRATEAAKPSPAAAVKHEASRAMAGQAMPNAMPNAMAGGMAGPSPMQKSPARAGAGGMRFDLSAWLARYRTAPSEQPSLSTELQMQHAMLPIEPVDAIDVGLSSSAYLRALMMDPAYQLQ